MANGDFSKYNQAVLATEQRQQISEAKSSLTEQKKTLSDEEIKFQKSLRAASLSGKYSPEAVLAAKQQIQQQKSQLSTSQQQILKAESKLNAPLAQVKTPEQLEARGYKKRVSGSTVIYYKEDSYSYRTSSGKKRRETYVDEEYTFVNGKPKRIVKRDDYRDDDKIKVDESEIIEFSEKGTVSSYKSYDNGKKREFERYDSLGRLTSQTEYDREGKKEERQTFNYNSDGTVSVEKRDYDAERKAQAKAQAKYESQLADQRKVVNMTASVDWAGNSTYSETKFNQETQQWEKTTTTYTKQAPKVAKVSSTKTLQATKTPIFTEQLKVTDIKNLGLSTGVNQGTTTQNVPQINLKSQEQIQLEKQISKRVVNTIDLSTPESVRQVQTVTSTPQQIKAMQDVKATAITGREVTFSLSSPKENEVNLNPVRILSAPYQIGSTIGTYLAENVQGKRSIVSDTKKVVSSVSSDPLGTGKNIVVGTIEKVATDPFGFVGETLALEGAARIGGSAVKAARKAKVKVDPIEFNTRSVNVESAANRQGLGIEVVETTGKVKVESGIFKKKTEIVDVQASGIINKETRALGVKDPDVAIFKENAISTEITPARVLEGDIKVSAKGKATTVKIEGIQQANKQIINVGDQTFFSETINVGKLDGETLFKTTTKNIKTGDLSVGLSKQPKSQGTTLPTQEAFAGSTITQTDVFLKQKDLAVSPEKIIDIEATSFKVVDVPKPKSTLQIKGGDLYNSFFDDSGKIRVETTRPKSEPIQRDFSSKGPTQVFEEITPQKQAVTDVVKMDKNVLDNFEQSFKTPETSSTNIPISETVIKDLIIENPKVYFGPAISFQTPINANIPQFKFDQELGISQKKEQEPTTDTFFDEVIKQDVSPVQEIVPAFSFKSDTKTRQRQRQDQVFDEIIPTPTPTPIPKPEIPVEPPKFNFSFAGEGKGKKSKGFNFESLKDDGQYIASLGGALTGKISKNPTKDITGLKFRAILLSKGRKKA